MKKKLKFLQIIISYKILIILEIILLSVILRFYNLNERFGLAYDQAHDALVAKYAVEVKQLPLLGPFASGGPFQTGGEWYWIIMLGTILFPTSILGPWILMGILSVLLVFLMMYIGYLMYGFSFSILVGLLTATSPSQISQSSNLANQTPIGLFSAVLIIFSILFLRTKKAIYLFLMGLSLGFASSIHLQGVALLPLILLTLIFSKTYSHKKLLLLSLGLILPWIPVLLVDVQNNFYNIKHMISYYLFNPNPIPYEALGRRWLTFLGIFTPNAWANIAGGFKVNGYLLIGSFFLILIYQLWKKTIRKDLILLVLSFLFMLVILRYTRTPLFDSYLVFLHPLILLFTAYIFFTFLKTKLFLIFSVLYMAIIISNINIKWNEIMYSKNETYAYVNKIKKHILKNYPDKKFAIYDFKYNTTSKSFPLALQFYYDNRIDDSGMKIGFLDAKTFRESKDDFPKLIWDDGNLLIADLTASMNNQLESSSWTFINPGQVYNATENWHAKP